MVFVSRNILLHHRVRWSSCGGHRTHDVNVFAREQVSCEQQTRTESNAQAWDVPVALFHVLGALCTVSSEHQTCLLQSLLQHLLHTKSIVGFSTEHQTRLLESVAYASASLLPPNQQVFGVQRLYWFGGLINRSWLATRSSLLAF
jgi:hypothetical protein